MNILAYEEIQKVEESILALYQREGSPLNLPSQNDLLNLKSFQSQLFKQTSPRIKALVQKKLMTEDRLVSVSTTEENGVIKMFIYNLLAVIYGPSLNNFNTHILQKRNLDLLNNLKCSLYCKDIKFSLISNPKLQVEKDQQGQMLIAHFLKFIENLQKTETNTNTTLKCIEWLLQHNPLLLQIFILFMRFILMKLEVEGAEDYRSLLRSEQAIINLIEYFDLSYRCSDGLILFYEQGYFLTFVQKQIVFGQYNFKISEEGQLKTNVQKITSGANQLIKSQSQATKKSQNSNKIVNRLLTSSCQSQNYQNSLFDQKQETPHFKSNAHFYFQRRRQEDNDSSKEKQLRKQFAKVISDSDFGSEVDKNTEKLSGSNNISTPPTPTWCKESCFVPQKPVEKEFRSTIELSSNIMFRRKNMDSIKEVDQNLERTKKHQNDQKQLQNGKNLVKVVDRGFQPLSPQAEKTKNQGFAFVCDENFGFFQGHNESIRIECSQQNYKTENFNLHQCMCRPFRLLRNSCISKVVQFCFQPQKNKRKENHHPSFFNSKNTVHVYKAGPLIKVTPPKQPKNLKASQARQDRIPAFLKTKKEKTELSTSSKGAKKSIQVSKKQSNQKRQKSNFAQSFKRYSQIILQPKYQYSKNSNSLKKHHHSNSNHKNCPEQAENLKKFDVNHFQSRPGLGQPDQSMKASGNYNYPPNYHQNMAQFGQFLKETEKANSPFRFFAPVQIIAPTVYVHSTNRSEGQVIFNVNKNNPQLVRVDNQPMSVPGTNLFNGIQRDLNSNRSEKIINSFQQKYL